MGLFTNVHKIYLECNCSSGVAAVQKAIRAIAKKCTKQVEALKSAQHGELIAITVATNAQCTSSVSASSGN